MLKNVKITSVFTSIITTYVKIMDMTTRDGINTALKVIGAAGFEGVEVAAPNAVQALGFLLKKTKAKDSNHEKIMKELKRQGLVQATYEQDHMSFTITPAGVYRLQLVIINEIEIPKPAAWDKKWRVVTFDVPVRRSKERAYFTSRLQHLGFVMLQRSMWAHPFESFEEIQLLASHYNIMRYCTLFEVSKFDDLSNRKLLRHFNSLQI
jgi:hypothetical protein